MKHPLLAATLLLFLALVAPLAAGERLAFVLGVNTYDKLPQAQLQVAVADAKRMDATLRALDPAFGVTLVTDADWRTAQTEFDAFLARAKGAECVLVYFAGHGIEYHGENYLLVRDSDVSDISADVERMKRRLATAAVSMQGWVDSLEGTKAQVKVVILDCCRNNPLQASDDTGTRSVVGGSRGLAQVTPPSGTLISYSADAGQTANDGLFTETLAANLKTPGLSIVKVFAKTREEVRRISTQWANDDAEKNVLPAARRVRHEPAEYNKLDLAGTDFTFTRGAVKVAEVKDDQAAEIAALKAKLAAMAKAQTPAGNDGATIKPLGESTKSVGSTPVKPSDDFARFAALDRNADGTLSFEEAAVDQSEQRLREWDVDRDGRISLSEWQAAHGASKLPGESGKSLGSTPMKPFSDSSQFMTMDKDGDGTLTFEEVGTVHSESQARQWDANADGRVSKEEWQAAHARSSRRALRK